MPTRPLTPVVRERVGKLILLLASDKAGEILAATSAIERVLKSNGLDLHDLAAALGTHYQPNNKQTNNGYRYDHSPEYAQTNAYGETNDDDDHDWVAADKLHVLLRAIQQRAEHVHISDHARQFLADLIAECDSVIVDDRDPYVRLSRKQKKWISSLARVTSVRGEWVGP
jgi:hypothetical protein